MDEEREAKLIALREAVRSARDDPRRYTWDEVDAAINADLDSLELENPNYSQS